ncbi:unnamed protein product [Leptidea sinapis]|uniref:GDP-D-glucose phosphorylase 1 n=1 Tax=Leptidea sinapis TaxID=189913 RepID=A0A5E4QUW8_9NEOP|nr:unnamed protein product [Leptidea sinapis]
MMYPPTICHAIMNSKSNSYHFRFENFNDERNIMEHIKTEWDKVHKTTVFRYKVSGLKEKYIAHYFIQLNPDRKLKRRIPEDINEICQKFDDSKFNFTRVPKTEIILNFWEEPEQLHTIIGNVSPINRYHSLICPSVNKKLPQIVTEDSLRVVLEVYYLAKHCDLRIGFNSLCALASVNHLHYHLFVITQTLPVETVKCSNICGPLWVTQDYPVPAFCFETSPQNIQVEAIYKLIGYLLSNSIAHNIFITRGEPLSGEGSAGRVFVWPRKSVVGAKQPGGFNVAACELSGWFPVYKKT